MFGANDIVKQVRAADWSTKEEVDLFIERNGNQPPSETLKLLALVTDRRLRADAPMHRLRCTVFAGIVERSLSEELFVPFLGALDKCDAVLRPILIGLIPKVNNVGAHAEMARLLGSDDPELRGAVAKVVQQVGGKTCLEILTRMAAMPEYGGREEALNALVPRAGHHALPLMKAVMEAGDPRERAVALKYLGSESVAGKAPAEARVAIVAAFQDADERVQIQAIVSFSAVAAEDEFLDRVHEKLDSRSPLVVKAVIDGLRRYRSKRVIQLLARRLRKGPNVVRIAVLEALESIATDDVIPPLVEALEHKQIVVRAKAGEALSALAQGRRIDIARAVLWLLRSKDVNVRRMAVEVINKVGDPAGDLAPRLLRHLRDEDWWVRERIMDALTQMSSLPLAKHLVDYLDDSSDVVRRYAIGALVRIKDPRTLGALLKTASADKDWWVQEQAVEAVGLLGDARAVPYLVDVMQKQPQLRRGCVEALRSLRSREAAPQVANLLRDADPELRLAIVQCLGALEDRSQAFALMEFENDEDPKVRTAVRELLVRWKLIDRTEQHGSGRSLALLDRLLIEVARGEGDDLLIAAGRVPYMKKLGAMVPLSQATMNSEQVLSVLVPCLSQQQRELVEQQRDIDFSYEVVSRGLRFRAHVFTQLTGLSACFRIVKNEIPNIERLGLPPIVHSFAHLKNGLVLVGGPTGSGKSTTLAALIDSINQTQARHVVSLEDPIEVVHSHKKSLVNQREIGSHTRSFANALRSTLRQDPDVILVGEMRDYATISFAVTAAETGHLVFGTVHTVSADTSVDRLINAFPPAQQSQVRAMLAESLRAVVCQHLLRRIDAPGRVVAAEVMLNNDAVSNLIRKGKAFQIPSTIATSRDSGMLLMDQELVRLVRGGVVDPQEAFMKSVDKKAFETMLAGEQAPRAAAAGPVQRKAAGA